MDFRLCLPSMMKGFQSDVLITHTLTRTILSPTQASSSQVSDTGCALNDKEHAEQVAREVCMFVFEKSVCLKGE